MAKREQAGQGRPDARKPSKRTTLKPRAPAENARITVIQRELADARTSQTATAEILRIISGSPFDLHDVLDLLTVTAKLLCRADMASISRQDAAGFHHVTSHGFPTDWVEYNKSIRLQPGRGSAIGRALMQGKPVQIADVLADPEYTYPEPQKKAGYRTFLAVPLLRDGNAVGVLSLCRKTVKPFTKQQVELVSSFADQAVIAIENARLVNELQARTEDLRESLQQQTATADVLKVISRSAFDLQVVLDTLVESAAHLCGGDHVWLFQRDGDQLRWSASFGHGTEIHERVRDFFRTRPVPIDRGSVVGRSALDMKITHVNDVLNEPGYAWSDAQKIGGYRAGLGVPLLREGAVTGVIFLAKSVPEPFNEKQIELAATFADQAVIAIENVRLFREVQARTEELNESLQQQTATADVLKVISRSAFDLKTVLHTLVESAVRLTEADKGTITRMIDGEFYRAESVGFSQAFMDYVRGIPVRPERGSATGRALLEGVPVHIPDYQADPEYNFTGAQQYDYFRTMLGIPLMREGTPIGVLVVARSEVRPFTEKQIELVTTFADQAAIAIENSRLFEEVQSRTRELSRSLEELRLAQNRLVQTEKLASLGQLTAGIAHEIKNPLNFVNNFSALSAELVDELNQLLKAASPDGKMREEINELAHMLKSNLEKVVQHGRRADSIVKNMLLHSREGSGEFRSVDVNALVDESLNLAYHGARAEKPGFNIILQRKLDPAAGAANAFPQEIIRVLLNIISNGFYAATRRAAEASDGIEPILVAATRNLGEFVEIRIRDNGAGMPAEVKAKIFTPFFTTKPPGEGTGLGLSMSHDIIVKQHGGKIDVETEAGKFTEFVITLPRNSADNQNGNVR